MDIHVSARQLASAACLWGLTAMASAAEPAWMVTPYLGYSTQMNFENTDSSTLHSKASNNWGLMVHKEVENQGEIGFIYSYQNSDISPSGHDDLTTQYLHFSGALRYPDNPLTPYVGASLGITRLSAYDSVIKPSMSLAVGVQPKINDRMALMAELRGYGTAFSSDSEFICDPAIACGAKIQSQFTGQLQANIGFTFNF